MEAKHIPGEPNCFKIELPMNKNHRIILVAEDGTYTLRDGINSLRKANYIADRLVDHYGEGQRVYVEQYEN